MEKRYWKEVLALSLLALSLSGIVGCQDGKKPVSLVSDAPPGANNDDDNRIIASMGTVNLGNKQVLSYLQSLNPRRVSAAINKDGGLEDLVKGVALRANVVARATREGWPAQAAVQTRVEEAQRNVLYNMYINERSIPAENYPGDDAVAKIYEARKQLLADSGKAAPKSLEESAPVIRQRLRAKQKQRNEKKYINRLVTSNPITVDLEKLVEVTSLSQQQKQQGAEYLQASVARMGDVSVRLEQVLASLGNKAPAQQRKLLNNSQLLQQYLHRLTIQHFVVREATAAKFNSRPTVNNHLEQARLQVIYATYMKNWSAPKSDFPGAALIEESYQEHMEKLVVPDRYQLARIVILNSGDSAADEIQVSKLATEARASGADFAALAGQYSQEPRSAKNGGNIGWINTQALSPEMRQLITGNQPGTVVGPLQYQWGWRIVKILDHQPARQQTLEEVRPALVAVLRKQRAAENEKQILEQLVTSDPVTIDRQALQQLRQKITG